MLCMEHERGVDLTPLVQLVHTLSEIAEFGIATKLLIQLGARENIAHDALQGAGENLLRQARLHPQGGVLAALEVCRLGRTPFDPDLHYLGQMLPVGLAIASTHQLDLAMHHLRRNELTVALPLLTELSPSSRAQEQITSFIEEKLSQNNLDAAWPLLRLDIVKMSRHPSTTTGLWVLPKGMPKEIE